jgi:predicted nucleotidyltransferase
MNLKPEFPTELHEETAKLVRDYFMQSTMIDTVLVVNSCARGQAAAESDLDFAILIKPGIPSPERIKIENAWQSYMKTEPTFSEFEKSGPFAQLHLDIIDGIYQPSPAEKGGPIDYFEIEIGNQICYSAPMSYAGPHLKELQSKWLPYYNEEFRLRRLKILLNAVEYDLDHIASFVKRELYFQAFDLLYKAFQKYLQVLFISNRIYPIAYNKWIKEQVIRWLNKPDLYPKLSPILSLTNIESKEIVEKASLLRELLDDLTND